MIVGFRIDSRLIPEKKFLTYSKLESSFDMTPYGDHTDFTVILNYLELSADEEGRICHIDGYCPMESWKDASFTVPESKKGSLIVNPQLESGRSYRLNPNGDWSVYKNKATGWICIGSLQFEGDSVEFLDNCIAVLTQGQLISIYLMPKFTQ